MLFGIIGGDRRQEELLALLRRDGYTVAACGVAGEMDWDAAVAAEVVILPLPLCKEGDTLNIEGPRRGAGALFRQLRRDQLILAGQVKPAQAALAAELDLKLVDYFQREELTVANAAATAEGTVQVILEHLERSLLGSQCLVLGFGRIGKLLCHRLTAMGTRVTAAADGRKVLHGPERMDTKRRTLEGWKEIWARLTWWSTPSRSQYLVRIVCGN